jgi:hypothetical protein
MMTHGLRRLCQEGRGDDQDELVADMTALAGKQGSMRAALINEHGR